MKLLLLVCITVLLIHFNHAGQRKVSWEHGRKDVEKRTIKGKQSNELGMINKERKKRKNQGTKKNEMKTRKRQQRRKKYRNKKGKKQQRKKNTKKSRKKSKGKKTKNVKDKKKNQKQENSCRDVTCLSNLIHVMKIYKDQVQNFLKQNNRITKKLDLAGIF